MEARGAAGSRFRLSARPSLARLLPVTIREHLSTFLVARFRSATLYLSGRRGNADSRALGKLNGRLYLPDSLRPECQLFDSPRRSGVKAPAVRNTKVAKP